jgi:hypothetical protein
MVQELAFLSYILEIPGPNLAWMWAILTENFHGFPNSPRVNAELVH